MYAQSELGDKGINMDFFHDGEVVSSQRDIQIQIYPRQFSTWCGLSAQLLQEIVHL